MEGAAALPSPSHPLPFRPLPPPAIPFRRGVEQVRLRTRDLLRIMNCVQCNLCRLHGKVSALGLASSLQVILGTKGSGEEGFRPDTKGFVTLHRVEVAAMVTFCAKLSAACDMVHTLEAIDDA